MCFSVVSLRTWSSTVGCPPVDRRELQGIGGADLAARLRVGSARALGRVGNNAALRRRRRRRLRRLPGPGRDRLPGRGLPLPGRRPVHHAALRPQGRPVRVRVALEHGRVKLGPPLNLRDQSYRFRSRSGGGGARERELNRHWNPKAGERHGTWLWSFFSLACGSAYFCACFCFFCDLRRFCCAL